MNFIWQGQSCSSTSRLFVHDCDVDEVVERVAAKAGDPRRRPVRWTTRMGAIISAGALEKVEHYVELGKAEGARLLPAGGGRRGRFEKGFWYQPTVFADVTPDMRIAREEIFGPVLSILRWTEVDEVDGDGQFGGSGLTGAVWTQDISQALRTARRLQSGYIWINGVNIDARAVPIRRLQEQRHRARARHRGALLVHRGEIDADLPVTHACNALQHV